MIDLHTHSLFSDGELIPAELVRRARDKGYEGIAITDHADSSNLDWIIPRLVRFCENLKKEDNFRVVPGIELTHVDPESISLLTRESRKLGAKLVIVHGETIVEPVSPGTNRAALEAGVNILAHPGLITDEEALLAKDKGILLEISSRKGHSLTNGHVARLAKKFDALLIFDTDAHSPGDLIDSFQARRVVLGAGLSDDDWKDMRNNARNLLRKIFPQPDIF
jgi:histidinol phosphatase-like PHP family hydrolase